MIREATASDIPMILDLGYRFVCESGVGDVTGWDEASARQLVETLIDSPDGILVVGSGSMLGGIIHGHPFNNACRVFLEIFWRAENRGGLKLLKKAEQLAREKGASRMLMLSLDAMPSLDRLYLRHGYRPLERTFVKEL